jgi:RimJ/RimL family protein N-acetyltransferase
MFLEGARLYLRGLRPSDAAGDYPSWLNDPEVCAGNGHRYFPYGAEEALDFIGSVRGDRTSLVLAMVLKEGDRHVGNISLQGIHPIHRTAEFAILLGAKDCWGKGYAREAGILICRHGFSELDLRRIACGTAENNLGMQALALALGMRPEGRRRGALRKGGRYLDVLEYGMFREEFFAVHPDGEDPEREGG